MSGKELEFEMMTIHSDMIRILFETLKEILQDVNIICDEYGMRITALESTRVAFVNLELYADDIRMDDGHYRCDNRVILGINLPYLYKLIKMIAKDDVISFYKYKNVDKLYIKIENKQKKRSNTLEYKIYDLDEQEISLPKNLYHPVKVTLNSQDFSKDIKDMTQLGDKIKIQSIDNNLIYSCEGDWANINIVNGETNYLEFLDQSEDVIQGTFSLRFLQLFTKATNLCIKNKLCIGNNVPLLIEYPVPNLGLLTFLLGQQMEE